MDTSGNFSENFLNYPIVHVVSLNILFNWKFNLLVAATETHTGSAYTILWPASSLTYPISSIPYLSVKLHWCCFAILSNIAQAVTVLHLLPRLRWFIASIKHTRGPYTSLQLCPGVAIGLLVHMSEWLPGCYIESDSIPNNLITISIISKVLISINNHIQST